MAASDAPTTELGHATGNVWSHDYPFDASELSPELQWPLSVSVFDKMRRQDAQVQGVLKAIFLPIRRAKWMLDPNGARPEVVQLVAEDLSLPIAGEERPPSRPRSRDRFSWEDHLRLALLSVAYGHYGFEQVYRIDDSGPTLRARLHKLAERMPTSIAKIKTNVHGGLDGIQQYGSGAPGSLTIDIGVDRLVWYVNDREGSNWQGLSVLRPAYGPWMLKARLMRVHAIAHERNGMGVPIAEAPPGASESMMRELNALAQSYRAGEASGGAVPNGTKLFFKGVEGSLPDTLGYIRYLDEQIAKNVLAQFLELGSTKHGSRSLGESFIDFFQLALDAVASQIADTATQHIVEDLVDLNWGTDEPAPRIVPGATDSSIDLPAQSLADLIAAGAIVPDDRLETYLREKYRFPEADPTTARATPAPAPAGGSTDPTGDQVRARRREHRTPGSGARVSAAAGDEHPAHWWMVRVENAWAPKIATALAAGWDTDTVARMWSARQVLAAAGDDSDERAFLEGFEPSSDDLTTTVGSLYEEGYVVGAHAALRLLPDPTAPEWEQAVEWATWTPGNAAAAAKAAGLGGAGGLQQLLADAQVTIQGIQGTTLDRLASTLADGTAQGWSTLTLAEALHEIVNDPARAALIAQTETARVVTAATLDTYRSNGVERKAFLTAEDDLVDDECTENEDAGDVAMDDDFPNGDPPVHPGCRCAVMPVLPDPTEET